MCPDRFGSSKVCPHFHPQSYDRRPIQSGGGVPWLRRISPVSGARLDRQDDQSALRRATAPLHAEIDALFSSFDLGTRAGLTRFLIAQAIALRACQPRAVRFTAQHLDCQAPDYAQALTADLAALGVAAEALPSLELPGSIADAGVFYVVAGSRMGAAVLRKRATAPIPGGRACGYFAVGHGPAIWRSFGRWLSDQGCEARASGAPSALPELVKGATAAFRLFGEAARLAACQPVTYPLATQPGLPV